MLHFWMKGACALHVIEGKMVISFQNTQNPNPPLLPPLIAYNNTTCIIITKSYNKELGLGLSFVFMLCFCFRIRVEFHFYVMFPF